MKFSTSVSVSIMAVCLALVGGCTSVAQQTEATTSAKNGAMPVNYINSSKEAYAAMRSLPTSEPIQMLNMVRFNDQADYEDGSMFDAKGWSGEQAYAEYTRRAGPIAARLGGNPIYVGVPQLTLIGPEHENWDAIFIIQYPNVAALLALTSDPEYQTHAFHRSAAVADSRLIRMTPPVE